MLYDGQNTIIHAALHIQAYQSYKLTALCKRLFEVSNTNNEVI